MTENQDLKIRVKVSWFAFPKFEILEKFGLQLSDHKQSQRFNP
jgi:hypothetical protein